jgi:heme exporter protein CcmD
MTYLVIAYTLIAVVLAGYIGSIVQRRRSVDRALKALDEQG